MPQKTPSQHLQELRDLLVAYVKQETVEPIKGLGRFVGLGAAAALLFGMGAVFIAVGILRMLQGTGVFDGGSWGSLLAYLIVIASLGAGAALFVTLARRATRRAETPDRTGVRS